MTKLPSKPLVIVKWLDAHSPLETDVVDDKNIDEILHKSIPMNTVGWLLKEDLKGVSVGSEWCGDDDFRSTTFIPRALIVSIHRLSRSRKLHADPSTSFDGGLTPVV